MALEHSHPRWIVDAFRDALGGSLDDTALLLEADNSPAPGDSTARWCASRRTARGRCDTGSLARWIGSDHWRPRSSRGGARSTSRRPGRGQCSRCERVVSRALDGPDVSWLDLCAGPGGKSALLASEADRRATEATLTAVEVQPHRADLVRMHCLRVSGAHEVVCADGRDDRFAGASLTECWSMHPVQDWARFAVVPRLGGAGNPVTSADSALCSASC